MRNRGVDTGIVGPWYSYFLIKPGGWLPLFTGSSFEKLKIFAKCFERLDWRWIWEAGVLPLHLLFLKIL